jgi:predicted MFS family arabinose efflux permease
VSEASDGGSSDESRGLRIGRARTVGLVAGLFCLSTAAAAYEIVPASVIPLVRDSLGVGATGASWLVSVMYATAVVSSVPVGVLLDRVSIRRAVAVTGVALLATGAWGYVTATEGQYWALVASRVVGGFCYVLIWNAGAKVVGDAVEPSIRATAVGIFTASAPVGFALGQFGGPLVATRYGWEAALPAFTALAAVGVPLFLASTRGVSLDGGGGTPSWGAVRDVFHSSAVWILSGLCFLAFVLYLFLNSWLPSYFTSELSFSLAVGGLLTAVFPAVGVLARTGSGVVSDRLFGGRRRPIVRGAFLVAVPTVSGFVLVESLFGVIALLVVAGVAVQLVIALLYSYIAEVVAPDVRTTAVSILTSVGLLGAFVAPLAGGVVVETAGYTVAFALAGVTAAVGVLLAWVAPSVRE